MSDLRKRFEKETGKKVEITAHFDCEDSECDYDVPVDIWNNEYIMWLENLANGVTASDSGLHLQRVSVAKHPLPRPLECWSKAQEMECGDYIEWHLNKERGNAR